MYQMKYNLKAEKETAELYYRLYQGCIKFKSENIDKKEIDCSEYYNNFEFYANKYIEHKHDCMEKYQDSKTKQ